MLGQCFNSFMTYTANVHSTQDIPSALFGSFMHPLMVQNDCNKCVKNLRFLVYNKTKF